MAKILLVYSTKWGQTKKIMDFIAMDLHDAGHLTEIYDVEHSSAKASPSNYEAVVVGAPVYLHGFSRNLEKWIKSVSTELLQTNASFFSVCLGILQDDEKVRLDEAAIVEKFFNKTGWRPRNWTIFAGALPYTKYNWFVKRVMKRIAKKAGGATDITRDFEYTDWRKVSDFAKNITRSTTSLGR